MKTILKTMGLMFCVALLVSMTAAAEANFGWKADFTDMSVWRSEERAEPSTDFIGMDAPASERYVEVEANGDLGGFKAKIVDNNTTPWKCIATQITIDLDKTPWLHIRHSAAPVSYCVKVTQEKIPTEGLDTALFGEGTSTAELAVNIKDVTGWKGEVTMWVKYFMIDGTNSGGQNITDVFSITDSMALVGAAAPTEAPTEAPTKAPVTDKTDATKPATDKTTVSSVKSTTSETKATGGDVEESSNVLPIVIGVVVAVVVIGGVTAFVVIKKKKGAQS